MDKPDVIIDIEAHQLALDQIRDVPTANKPVTPTHQPLQIYMAQGYPHPSGGYPHPAGGGYQRGGYPGGGLDGGNLGYGLPTVFDIDDNDIRNQFVRKVFFTLGVQLLVTTLILAFCYLTDEFRTFVFRNTWFPIVCVVLFFVSYYGMICSNCLRNYPINYVCITVMTLSMAFTVGVYTLRHKWQIVLGAFGGTVLIVLILTCLAFSSIDFTKFYMYFVVFAIIMIAFGIGMMITSIFYKRIPLLHLVYSCLMILFYSGFILMELQMILGGRSLELSPEDYIMASALLYTSIVSLFLSLMDVLGS